MNAKPCAICGRPMHGAHPRRVTCGHPRCRREQNRRVARAPKPVPPPVPDNRDLEAEARDTIRDLMRRAIRTGASPAAAMLSVAQATGEPVAVVRSVWRSMGGEL